MKTRINVYLLLSVSILLNLGLTVGWLIDAHQPFNSPEGLRDPVLSNVSIVQSDLAKYSQSNQQPLLQDASWRLNYSAGMLDANSIARNSYDLQVMSTTLSGFGVWLEKGKNVGEVTKDINIFERYLRSDSSANGQKLMSNEKFFEHQIRMALNQIPVSDKQGEN